MVLPAPGTRTACSPPKNHIRTACFMASAANGVNREGCSASTEMIHGTGVQESWHDNGKHPIGSLHRARPILWTQPSLASRRNFDFRTFLSSRSDCRCRDISCSRRPTTKPFLDFEENRRGFRRKHPQSKSAFIVFSCPLCLKSTTGVRHGDWFQKETADTTARLLGRFKRESEAKDFVSALYQAGAVEVIVPDIYQDKTGNQFADCLLVRLSKDGARRKAVRRVCAQLRQRKLGASQPDKDIGETHLYLSMV